MSRINISLTTKGSLQNAIKQLEEYRDSISLKTEAFIREMTRIGVNVAMMTRATKGQGDTPRGADFYVNVSPEGDVVKGTFVISSEKIVFWEFGAGIHFNGSSSPNPSKVIDFPGGTLYHAGGAELGYTIGSYGQHQGLNDYWFYYEDGDKAKSKMSHGTEAIMPMYTAELEMIDNIYRIAKETFR